MGLTLDEVTDGPKSHCLPLVSLGLRLPLKLFPVGSQETICPIKMPRDFLYLTTGTSSLPL